jgi:hypothetical protein
MLPEGGFDSHASKTRSHLFGIPKKGGIKVG